MGTWSYQCLRPMFHRLCPPLGMGLPRPIDADREARNPFRPCQRETQEAKEGDEAAEEDKDDPEEPKQHNEELMNEASTANPSKED